MKKIILTTLFLLISIYSFAALKDGNYNAQEEKFNWFGWKGYVKITVKNGAITEVEYDHKNKEGALQSTDKKYNDSMYKSKKIDPKTFTAKLEKELLDEQSAQNIDAVAGATQSKDKFVQLSKLLLEKAEKGETGDYVLKKSKLEKIK